MAFEDGKGGICRENTDQMWNYDSSRFNEKINCNFCWYLSEKRAEHQHPFFPPSFCEQEAAFAWALTSIYLISIQLISLAVFKTWSSHVSARHMWPHMPVFLSRAFITLLDSLWNHSYDTYYILQVFFEAIQHNFSISSVITSPFLI